MNLVFLDVLILLASFTAVVGGYRLGFLARSMSWIGLAAGTVLASLAIPALVRGIGVDSSSGRLYVVVLILVAGALLGQMAGLFAGSRMSAAVPAGAMRVVDRVAGSLFGLAGVAVLLWVLIPIAAQVPGWSARQVRQSQIVQHVFAGAPRPPDAFSALGNLVGSTGVPSVFEDFRPTQTAGPPPSEVPLSQETMNRVKASTVKVEGVACRRTQDGSGFAIGPDLIATNAHVVAGERRTTVLTPEGDTMNAVVVYFDPGRDIALLSVPRYDAPALPLESVKVGEKGAVFGHPKGVDEVRPAPATVARQITAVGRDLYNTTSTRRDVLVLAAELAQGDSGGALVNVDGEVVGMAFAIAPDKADTAYALSTKELRAALNAPRNGAVDTGDCVE